MPIPKLKFWSKYSSRCKSVHCDDH